LTVDAISPGVGEYTIRRSVQNPAVVLDSSGTVTNLKPTDVIGIVEIFGQHELAELAQDKSLVARMLERFAGHDGEDEAKREVVHRLSENREALRKAEEKRDAIDAKLADLPRLKDQLAHFEADGPPAKLKEQERLTKDESVFAEGRSRLGDALQLTEVLNDEAALEALEREIAGITESPEQEVLTRVQVAAQQVATAVRQAAATLTSALEAAQAEIDSARTEWSSRTEPLRQGHAEALTKLREAGYDPDRYLATTAAIASVKGQETERDVAVGQLTKLNNERQSLLKQLVIAEADEEKRLKDAIRKANSVTSKVVNVRSTYAPDRAHLTSVVADKVSGQRTQIVAAIEAGDFSTKAFVAAIRKGADEVEAKYGIKGAQLSNLFSAGEPLLRQFEELSVGYAVDVYLNVGQDGTTEWRRLEDLSKGQRATALLLLLLGASSSPLVIDQPEDDLDNRFVYEGVVAKLCDLKGTSLGSSLSVRTMPMCPSWGMRN
jgi:hypothetical protein